MGFLLKLFLGPADNTAEQINLMEELLDIPGNKYIICRGYGSSTHDFTFACYLMMTNNRSFYSFGRADNPYHADNMTYFHSDFTKNIGSPLGSAQRSGNVYTRSFENCSVTVNFNNNTSSIVWGPSNRNSETTRRFRKSNKTNFALDGGNGNGQNVYLWTTSSNKNQQWLFN